jgi:hypothetical protein
MILSYCLDVGQVPLHIFFITLMFSYSNFIIYDVFTLIYNPDAGKEFIPNSVPTLG